MALLEGFPGGSDSKESACNAGDPGSIPGQEDPQEQEMATHSSISAWRIPWTEKPRGRPRGRRESDTTERLSETFFFFSAVFPPCFFFHYTNL